MAVTCKLLILFFFFSDFSASLHSCTELLSCYVFYCSLSPVSGGLSQFVFTPKLSLLKECVRGSSDIPKIVDIVTPLKQYINLLVPPPPEKTLSASEKCRCARFLISLSECTVTAGTYTCSKYCR
jgi:hypothetical protein